MLEETDSEINYPLTDDTRLGIESNTKLNRAEFVEIEDYVRNHCGQAFVDGTATKTLYYSPGSARLG